MPKPEGRPGPFGSVAVGTEVVLRDSQRENDGSDQLVVVVQGNRRQLGIDPIEQVVVPRRGIGGKNYVATIEDSRRAVSVTNLLRWNRVRLFHEAKARVITPVGDQPDHLDSASWSFVTPRRQTTQPKSTKQLLIDFSLVPYLARDP